MDIGMPLALVLFFNKKNQLGCAWLHVILYSSIIGLGKDFLALICVAFS